LRTLLIDADLRLPSVERTLLTSSQAAGFSDLLLGDAHLGKAIHLTAVENLAVMPAGKRVPDPTKLFGRAQLEFLFAQLREDYDRVVIDTAPIHAVSDTLLLLPHVEAVCLVVRAGKTPASAVVRALEKLRDNGAKIVGFVLNALPVNNGGYYYHYHAKGYGADEVYGASAFAKTE
jgi:capsular exopolysaccharide synthesis family protein